MNIYYLDWAISQAGGGLMQEEARNPVSTVVRERECVRECASAEGRHISGYQTHDFS
ncbi:hypothetical protein [Microseira sp. BLCC-F43]|uniref:hypothetical protein n=1 Tax=Microseira sp. BLCC-F43 TaxID=3153602 RepID=UPI0035B857F2